MYSPKGMFQPRDGQKKRGCKRKAVPAGPLFVLAVSAPKNKPGCVFPLIVTGALAFVNIRKEDLFKNRERQPEKALFWFDKKPTTSYTASKGSEKGGKTMPIWMWVCLGFFSGSLMFSAWLPKWLCGVDVCQKAEDQNPGAANVFQQAGVPIGVMCLLCDLAKGVVPVVLALKQVPPRVPLFSLILIAPVAGHAFSPFRRFRGGKAITVSFGALLGASQVFPGVWVLAAWYLFFSLIVRICPNSVRTCVTYLFFAGTAFLWPVCRPFFAGCWGIAAIVYLKHIREAKASQGSLSFFHRSFTWESRSDSHH